MAKKAKPEEAKAAEKASTTAEEKKEREEKSPEEEEPAEEEEPEEEKPAEEEKPPEEKKTAEKEKPPEDKKAANEEKPPEEPPQPPPPFILYVDLHCIGCAKKIQRSILKTRGVEGVVVDMEKNQVTIKGVVEPQAVCNRIMKKTKRKAKVLSPAPAAEGEQPPPVVTSRVTGITTVELNVNMHCDACARQLKKKILKMRGVQAAATEASTGKVTVTGTMDAEKLVDYVYRRTKKHARIVAQPEPEPEPKPEPEPEKEADKPPPAEDAEKKEEIEGEEAEKPAEAGEQKKNKEEEPKNEGGGEAPAAEAKGGGVGGGGEEAVVAAGVVAEEQGIKRMIYHYQPLYVIERIPPPQLFSDENPNACCVS